MIKSLFRLSLRMVTAQQTPVLLMDEPVSNLDIAHQLDVMRLLRKATEKTVLIVIHDLNLALQFCDRLPMNAPHNDWGTRDCSLPLSTFVRLCHN